MRTRAPQSVVALGLLILAVACGGVEEAPVSDFAEAKALAAERGVPLLLDFFTEW